MHLYLHLHLLLLYLTWVYFKCVPLLVGDRNIGIPPKLQPIFYGVIPHLFTTIGVNFPITLGMLRMIELETRLTSKSY